MGVLDGVIVLAFAAYAIGSGLRARREASRDLEEYFLAGRGLSGWRAGISMAATQFAADTPLLVTGLIATAGIFALWRLWIYALAFLLLGFVLAPSWRRARVLTDAEFAELRYAGRPAAALRGVKAIYFGTVFNCTVLAMVLFAAVEITEPFLLWDEWLAPAVFEPVVRLVEAVGVPLTREGVSSAELWTRSARNLVSIGALALVTSLYSATGGLRSVVKTDIAQFAVMMLATLVFTFVAVDAAGGLAEIHAKLGSLFPGAGSDGPYGLTRDEILAFTPSRAHDAGFLVLAVLGLQWLVQMNADGTGYLAQRTMACRTDTDARLAAIVFTVAQVLLRSLLWLPLGLALLVLMPPDPGMPLDALRVDREATFVRGMELLPAGLLGLMLTAMLAALASTIDTHQNWGASYWTHDLYERFVGPWLLGRPPGSRSLLWVARLSTVAILALALAIMTRLSSIQTAWHASLLLGAGMGVMLVLRWVWWRVTAWGEIAAIAASALLAPFLLQLPAEQEALRLLLMAILSTAAGVIASLATPVDRESIARFYTRARPPGFWGPVARAVGEDPRAPVRRLARGLAAAGAAALSVFAELTGIGTWLVDAPAPTWFPWRGAWILLLVAGGLALVPFWWRGARSELQRP